MTILSNSLVVLMILLQTGFLILEMFLFNTPTGLRIFRIDQEFANRAFTLAKNQGLYNGFLAAGLLWGLIEADPMLAIKLKVFFLVCVLVAGIYGAATASKGILMLQALPAAVALIVVLINR